MDRLKNFIERLSLEEKASLISGADNWHTKKIEKHNIDNILMSDGPHGICTQEHSKNTSDDNINNKATCFPTASAMASTWNPDLIYKAGVAVAQEAREENVSLLLGPGINIKRSPLCGRNFEYYSEDPFLTAKIAIGFINGVQSQGVGACLKHFAVNNCENMRMVSDSVIDERALFEIYLYAFEKCIKEAKPWAVMTSYNKLNGTFTSQNKYLLTEILKDQWSFEGAVVTDWAAVTDIVEMLKAGGDLEMPSSNGLNPQKVIEAVKNGNLSEEILDNAVYNVLKLVEKSVKASKQHYLCSLGANHYIAKKVAEEAVVLLKNENNILPVKNKNCEIAVIGAFAEEARIQGLGSSHVNAFDKKNCLELLRKSFPRLKYAKGYNFDNKENTALFVEAESLAKKARKILLFAGLTDEFEAEGADRKHISLPKNQLKLINRICEINKNTVVILTNGSAVEMPFANMCDGILETHLLGEAGAEAICDIITGKVNPSGKLAETYPLKLEDTPCYYYYPEKSRVSEYRESIYVGYRYYDTAKKDVLFPFGHGLSYTSFKYSDLKVHKANEQVFINFKVTNTGEIKGKETAQIYIRDLMPVIFKADKELKRFVKLSLNAGQTKDVEIILNKKDFAFYDISEKKLKVSKSNYEIMIGASSRDIRLKQTIALYEVDGAEEIAPTINKRQWPAYYNLTDKILSIPHLEFERILGYKPAENKIHTKGNFNFESTIQEIRTTEYGKKAASLFPKAPDNLPLKAFVIYSGGKFNYEIADMLISVMNEDGRFTQKELNKTLKYLHKKQ